jgi:IS5 family transposase
MAAITDDFFRRLDQFVNLGHSLAVLANRMPWQEVEASRPQISRTISRCFGAG